MDDHRKEQIRPMLQSWLQERMKSLQEQVMLTWEEGMGRLNPDDALLQKLADVAAPAVPAFQATSSDELEGNLGEALDLLESSANQGEVLKNMLHGMQPFVERSAIFVVKQGIATLYAQRGFESDNPRMGTHVMPVGELEALIQGRLSSIQRSAEAYKALLEPLSRFEASEILILPLRLRYKPVALLLVDSGLRQRIDHPHMVRALTHCTEAALSYQAGQKEDEKVAPAPVAPNVPTMQIPEPIQEEQGLPLDPKTRANAERSARVLVGDIELYFPAKVSQGKAQRNLYGVLKEEIERSRASFIDRYGIELEQQHRIFYQTLVQQLCEGDATRLGSTPWGITH